MAPAPLNVETEVVRAHGDRLAATAEAASADLSASVRLALLAQPGFPGAAARPFQEMVNALVYADHDLVAEIESAGMKVIGSAGTYEYCEERNTEQLRTMRIEF